MARSRWVRRIGIGIAAALAAFTLLGFFAVPPLVEGYGARQLSAQLDRPVTIARVAFNPFLLRLEAEDVHIGAREGDAAFADVEQLVVRASWASLWRFAPVINEVRLDRPQVRIVRHEDGRFNFSDLAAPAPAPAPQAEADPGSPLDLSLDHLAISDGTIRFVDAAVDADLALTNLAANLDAFSLLGPDAAVYSLSTEVEGGGALRAEGRFDLAGQWAETNLSVEALALALARPYLAGATPGRVTEGALAAEVHLRADWSKTPVAVTVRDSTLGLKGVRVALPDASTPAVSLNAASIAVAEADLAAQRVEISRIDLDGLTAEVVRRADGGVDLAALAPEGEPEAGEAGPAWHYRIGEIVLRNGRATFTDATTEPAAKIALAPVNLTVRNFDDAFSTPFPVTLDASLESKGALTLDGQITLDPLKVELKLGGEGIDITPFEPYATTALNARISRAVLNAKGGIVYEATAEGSRTAYDGDLELADVQVINRATSAEFAGWRSLALSSMELRYDAAAGLDLDTARVVFSNFYGHVLLDEEGRLHLRDILARNADGEPVASDPATQSGPLDAAASASETGPVRLHFGQIQLQNGQVTYTDNFITPNYTAELAEINGTIGAFGSASAKPAPIDVGATLTENGPISIKGTVNPLVDDPSLDLNAVAKGIELTNLTAYSTKYTGYPITKGKLNVDLHYRLANDRLTADNHIFIDQLTFGPRVENDTATDLPVQLAISLLKNRKNEINVDIPVSGSLNDPQFDIGSLLWNAVGNVFKKAITAPFTLLANAFGIGGGEDLGYVAFAPGAAELTVAARDKLDTVVTMLADKSSVEMDLIGRADPKTDVPALREAHVARVVRQQKLKEMAADGRPDDPATVYVLPAEYARYLGETYRTKIGGGARTVAEMEAALAAQAQVDADALRKLAQERAQAVRGYIGGRIPEKRIFVVAPRLDAEGIDEGPTTRVDFALK